ncbi:2-(3-amino-3-carboxypropyl)histidine synthase subunit [archaeon]|nr:2-(3-amino-3-carboxypropyl)histidine synthase subunit [archaeon]
METKKIKGLKTVFVPAKVKGIKLKPVLDKLKIKEKKIGLISAIQYVDYLEEAKKYLEKKGHKVSVAGQMVGCNVSNALRLKVDVFVFIGSGEFHPLELAKITKEIYFVNPVSEKVSKFSKEELTKLENKLKGKIKKYLMADKIGILVSTKPGQEHLKNAFYFAENCGKEAYVFLADEIDVNKLEDFNDIKIWVNSSCPRLEGNNIISMCDVLKY